MEELEARARQQENERDLANGEFLWHLQGHC